MKEFYVAKNSLLMGAAMGPGKDFSFRGFPCGQAEAMGTLTVTVSSAELWTPAKTTTALWLDASDATSLTLNGSTVSQWADKSGNNRHATQGTAGAQPTLETNRLSFDGGDHLSIADTAGLQFGTGDFAAVVVANITNVSKGIDKQDTIVSKNYTGFELHNYNGDLRGFLGGIDGYVKISGLTSGAWGIFSQIRMSNSHTVRRTGTASTAAANSVSASQAGQAVLIGARPGKAGTELIGKISEIILLPAGFTAGDLQLIEGYLAHKWDALLGVTTLVDALPSDHPYKSAPPTVSAAGVEIDPYWDHVVLLTQDQISDAKGHQLTVYGNTVATSSGILFDGNGDYITSPYSDDYDLSTSNFTLEAVVVPSGFSTGTMEIINKDGVFGNSYIQFQLGISSEKKAVFYVGNGTGTSGGYTGVTGTTVLLANEEYHIAGTMDGTTMRLFVNGVLEATGTKGTMVNSTAKPLYLGHHAGQPAFAYFRGVLRASRITKGVARYTNNFTVPTLPFPTA